MEHPVDLSVSLKFEIYKTATKHWLVLFAFLTCQALPAWPASPLPSACAQQATDHEHHLAQVLPESSLVDSRQGLLQPVAAQQRAQRLGHLATAATAPTLPARPPRHALRLQQLRAQLLVRRWVGEDEGQQGTGIQGLRHRHSGFRAENRAQHWPLYLLSRWLACMWPTGHVSWGVVGLDSPACRVS